MMFCQVYEAFLFTHKYLTNHVLKPGVARRNTGLVLKILEQPAQNVSRLSINPRQFVLLAVAGGTDRPHPSRDNR